MKETAHDEKRVDLRLTPPKPEIVASQNLSCLVGPGSATWNFHLETLLLQKPSNSCKLVKMLDSGCKPNSFPLKQGDRFPYNRYDLVLASAWNINHWNPIGPVSQELVMPVMNQDVCFQPSRCVER